MTELVNTWILSDVFWTQECVLTLCFGLKDGGWDVKDMAEVAVGGFGSRFNREKVCWRLYVEPSRLIIPDVRGGVGQGEKLMLAHHRSNFRLFHVLCIHQEGSREHLGFLLADRNLWCADFWILSSEIWSQTRIWPFEKHSWFRIARGVRVE